MSDNNPGPVAGGDGEGGLATEQLTREQVMAQRAEKKKLKEARKNKSGGEKAGGDVGGGKVKGDAPEVQKAPKKPQQQKQQSSDSSKGQSQQQKQGSKDKQPIQSSQSVPSVATANAPPVKKPVMAPPKTNVEAPPKVTSPSGAVLPKNKTSALAGEETKVATSDKSVGVSKTVEFQSTIQSLFKAKKGDAMKDNNRQLHPLFHSLGVKLRNNVIRGTNFRCIALLNSVKEYLQVYDTPSGMSFKHAFSDDLKTNMDTLRKQCPFAIGMTNAVEFLNSHLYNIDQDANNTHQLKEDVIEVIDLYIEEKIEKAVEAIVCNGVEKITSGDVIMVFSITEAVLGLLGKAAENGNSFELIILHTPETMLDIPELLKTLSAPISNHSVRISTVNFSNAIYRMRHCTKIIIGGHGLFTTGGVMAQSGSGKLALLASTYNKPAIFLCETYKFCDRSPLDFFTLDEYMPEQSVTDDDLFEPKIKYDVTPANLVTVVVTDIDLLPSTSVPVVLRVQEGRTPKTYGKYSEPQ